MPHTLTPRERELAALVARGLTDKQIAAAAGITHTTVRNHLQNVREKLGITNRTQLAVIVLRGASCAR